MAEIVIVQDLQETQTGEREQIVSINDYSGYELDVAIVRRVRGVGRWRIRINTLAVKVRKEQIPDLIAALQRAAEIAAQWAESEGDDER